jgi:hypothetical protein
MNFSDEEYVRLYTNDTMTWDTLPWQSLALLALGLRKFDKSGVFDFGKHGAVRALSIKTRLPAEVVSEGLKAILDDEVWKVEGTKLFWPTYIEAQNCRRSERLRKRIERSRRSSEQQNEQSVQSEQVKPVSEDKCHVSDEKRDVCHVQVDEKDICRHESHSVTPGSGSGSGSGSGEAGSGILDLSSGSDARELVQEPGPQAPDVTPSLSGALPSEATDLEVADTLPQPEPKTRPERSSCYAAFDRSFKEKDPKAIDLFKAWQSESGLSGARYDHVARELFERLVSEGETVERIRQIVQGAKLEDWAKNTARLSAPSILGSSSQREKYIGLFKNPPKPKGAKETRRVQPNAAVGPMPKEWEG